jgi:hypothetical protein
MEPNSPADPVLEMTVEEAQQILNDDIHQRQEVKIIDDIYPWWKKLRTPLIILSGVIIVLCLSVITLAVTLQRISNDRVRVNEQDACYNLYTGLSSEATAAVRSASARVDNAGWTALVALSENGSIGPSDTEEIGDLIAKSEAALAVDQQRLEERSMWVAAGKPLPCPITSDDLNTGE